MKKNVLLFAAFLSVAATGYAQKANLGERVKMPAKIATERMQATFVGAKTSATPMRAKKDGLYYVRPAGTLYRSFTYEGNGYYPSFLIVPPFKQTTFESRSLTKASDIWTIPYQNTTTGSVTDRETAGDANNNFVVEAIQPAYMIGAPTLWNAKKTNSFVMSANNEDGAKKNPAFFARIMPDSIDAVSFVDDHGALYGFGSLNTGYIVGTGKIVSTDADPTPTGKDGTYESFTQKLPKPAQTLYVENAFCRVWSTTDTPIPAGKELQMTITDRSGQKVYAILTANADDYLNLGGPIDTKFTLTGEAYVGNLKFSQKAKDEDGNVYSQPFTLSDSTLVTVTGFNQEGVDVGFACTQLPDEDEIDFPNTDNANKKIQSEYAVNFAVTYPAADGGEPVTLTHWYPGLVFSPNFNAVMDTAIVSPTLYGYDSEGNVAATYENANVVAIPAAGGEGSVASTGLSYVPVMTAMDWNDVDGNEMYSFVEELPEWLSVTAEHQLEDDKFYTGETRLTFTADALPAGTEGRGIALHIKGRGTQSTEAIFINQGNYSGIAGTVVENNAKAANAIYNLNGQRVSKDFKGVLIQNGKKFVNK